MKRHIATFTFLAAVALTTPALAVEPIQTGWFSDTAVEGYDVVAYFDQGKPVKGKAKYSTEWQGAEWHFASADHLEKFRADPERYAPQYGGYCAWAVAQDDTAPGDPKQWSIVGGKLYLNYNAEIQKKWYPRRAELIPEADRNWPGLVDDE